MGEPKEDRILLSIPHVGPDERERLLAAFDANWIAPAGPEIPAFEQELAATVQVAHAAAVSSGTAALHLALLVLGVGSGDEVLTSTLTFAASANAICYVDARPVFIDSETETWNLDPELLERELRACRLRGSLPKAVLVVDIYGQCAKLQEISEICTAYGVPLIEDAAEALGASHRGRPAGSWGDLGTFSFNGNKIITTGGGGMLVSDRADWIDRARYLSTQARDPMPWYEHTSIGYNYRMNNLLAAIGRGQLANLEDRVTRRRWVHEQYRTQLGDLPGLEFMPEHPEGFCTFWLTSLTVDEASFGCDRDELLGQLSEAGIDARPVFKPMHLQPVYRRARVRGGAVAEDLFRRGVSLPSTSSLTEAEIGRVVEAVRAARR